MARAKLQPGSHFNEPGKAALDSAKRLARIGAVSAFDIHGFAEVLLNEGGERSLEPYAEALEVGNAKFGWLMDKTALQQRTALKRRIDVFCDQDWAVKSPLWIAAQLGRGRPSKEARGLILRGLGLAEEHLQDGDPVRADCREALLNSLIEGFHTISQGNLNRKSETACRRTFSNHTGEPRSLEAIWGALAKLEPINVQPGTVLIGKLYREQKALEGYLAFATSAGTVYVERKLASPAAFQAAGTGKSIDEADPLSHLLDDEGGIVMPSGDDDGVFSRFHLLNVLEVRDGVVFGTCRGGKYVSKALRLLWGVGAAPGTPINEWVTMGGSNSHAVVRLPVHHMSRLLCGDGWIVRATERLLGLRRLVLVPRTGLAGYTQVEAEIGHVIKALWSQLTIVDYDETYLTLTADKPVKASRKKQRTFASQIGKLFPGMAVRYEIDFSEDGYIGEERKVLVDTFDVGNDIHVLQ